MKRSAVISDCGKFRYILTRVWTEGLPLLIFVMLNPSTADGMIDDPTIRRCIGFARLLGYGGIMIGNLSAYRATNPEDLAAAGFPVGPENDATLIAVGSHAAVTGVPIICAWGANFRKWGRVAEVSTLLRRTGATLMALKFTADGVPRHPLYLSYDCKLQEYTA